MTKPKVIIITGPTGTGKTTLSRMVVKNHSYEYISGDEIKDELFPGVEDITEFPDKLLAVKEELLKRAKELFDDGKSVVIDYVILGEKYIKKIKNTFGTDLIMKVVLPSVESIMKRDKKRTNWTSGEDSVKHLYERYQQLKPVFGEENYIDNTGETPEETFEKSIKPLLN